VAKLTAKMDSHQFDCTPVANDPRNSTSNFEFAQIAPGSRTSIPAPPNMIIMRSRRLMMAVLGGGVIAQAAGQFPGQGRQRLARLELPELAEDRAVFAGQTHVHSDRASAK
jgi:hypothetical protein